MKDTLRAEYVRAVATRHATLTLPIGPADTTFRLEAIYQPLRLRRDPLALEDRAPAGQRKRNEENAGDRVAAPDVPNHMGEEDDDAASEHEGPVLVEHSVAALARSPTRRMVVLGGPGTGKTTALKRLTSDAAIAALGDEAAPLLVFVALPDLARMGEKLERHFDALVAGLGIEPAFAVTLRAGLAAGRLLVCLDSLDEVAPAQRGELIAQINAWAAAPGNIWVVGSRFTEYKGGQFAHGRFAEWSLEPLDATHRLELARRLLPALAARVAGTGRAHLSPTGLVAALEAHPQAATWGQNPLLFSLAAAVYARTGALPRSRAGLYGEVVRAVLRTREPDQARAEDLLALLAEAALRLYQTSGRAFSRAQLDAALAELHADTGARWDPQATCERIVASGALDVVARETYAFTHQTFQEYLAGAALAARALDRDPARRQAGWDLAWSKRTFSRWAEILCLFAGICAREHEATGAALAERWLLALVEQRARSDGDPGDLGLALAVATLPELADGAPEWRARAADVAGAVLCAWAEAGLADRQEAQSWRRRQRLAQMVANLALDEPARAPAVGLLAAALGDRYRRNAAIRLLGTLGGDAALAAVLARRHDPDPTLRYAVASALRDFGAAVPLETIRALSRDPSVGVRVVALQALGTRHADEDIELLLAALAGADAQSPGQRHGEGHAAAQALGRYGERAPIAALAVLARADDPMTRKHALTALIGVAKHVPINVFVEASRDPDWNVRVSAAQAFGALAPDGPVEPLIALLADASQYVRGPAVGALGKYTSPAAVEALVRVVSGPRADMKYGALRALGARAPRDVLEAALRGGESQLCCAALEIATMLRDGVPIAAILALTQHGAGSVRASAATALAKLAARDVVPLAEALPALTALLESDSAHVRACAAEGLGLLGEPGRRVPVERMLAAFARPDDGVRARAVMLLGERKDAATAALLARLLRDKRFSVKNAAARALGGFGALAPVDALLAALEDPDQHVRYTALYAIAQVGGHAPLEAIVARLGDPDARMRMNAAAALGTLSERAPVEALLAALRDEQQVVRSAAAQSLAKLGARAPVDALCALLADASTPVRVAAASALSALAESGFLAIPLEPVRRAAEDADQMVRRCAEAVLLLVDTTVPVERLIACLGDDRHYRRQRAAEKALARRRAEVPPRLLLSLLTAQSYFVVSCAARLLGQYGDEAPLHELLALVRQGETRVRRPAIAALGKLSARVPTTIFAEALREFDAGVRVAAAQALEARAPDVPKDCLREALDDAEWAVRLAAARALAAAGEPLDMEICLDGLEGGEDTSYTASAALIAYGDPATLPCERIVPVLGSTDDACATAALDVLARLCPEALGPVVVEAEHLLLEHGYGPVLGSIVRTQAAYAIGRMRRVPPALLDYLTGLLDWHYYETRRAAAWALGQIRRNIPDAAIRKLLALRSDTEMRVAADEALAAILSLEGAIEDE